MNKDAILAAMMFGGSGSGGGGGGVMRVEIDMQTMALNKTWQEISDCFANGGYAYVYNGSNSGALFFLPIVGIGYEDSIYDVTVFQPIMSETINFACSSPDEYPVYEDADAND